MPKPFPLQDLLELARKRTDVAAADLGLLNSVDRDAEQQLRRLLAFREEYQARFRESARHGLEHAAWRNFRSFIDRLDAAIALQRSTVEETRSRVAAGRAHWQAEQRKALSFDVLRERHQRAARLHEQRREQKEHDDGAASRMRTARGLHAG